MSKYIIENDEVRKYFYEEYQKINVRVTPGHYPNFKTKDEVDKWIDFMKKVEDNFRDLFNEDCKEEILSQKGDKYLLQFKSKFVGIIGSRKATKEELKASYELSKRGAYCG